MIQSRRSMTESPGVIMVTLEPHKIEFSKVRSRYFLITLVL